MSDGNEAFNYRDPELINTNPYMSGDRGYSSNDDNWEEKTYLNPITNTYSTQAEMDARPWGQVLADSGFFDTTSYNEVYMDDLAAATQGMNTQQIVDFAKQYKISPAQFRYHADEFPQFAGVSKALSDEGIYGADRQFDFNAKNAKERATKGGWSKWNNIIGKAALMTAAGAMVGGIGAGAYGALTGNAAAAGGAVGSGSANIGGSTSYSLANGATASSLAPSLMTTGELSTIAPSLYAGAEGATTGATAGLVGEGINSANYSLLESGELADIAPSIYSNTITPDKGLLDAAEKVGTKTAAKVGTQYIASELAPKPPAVDAVVAEATNHYASVLPEFTKYSLGSGYDRNTPSTKGLVNV